MRTLLAAILLLVAPAATAAQAPRPVTAEDYARAERFLSANATPLVDGVAGRPTWLAGGRFWYRVSAAGGGRFMMVDPARRTRAPAFDHDRLAQSLAAVTGRQIQGADLPFQTFTLSADGQALTVALSQNPPARERDDRRWTCDLRAYRCAAADSSTERHDPPPNSSVSPDSTRAVFIREHNLWMRDLATGRDVPLTTDGVEDFGYATNNAGWVKRDSPV